MIHIMSYKGKVENGKIILHAGATLPEGAEVTVVVDRREDDLPNWSSGLIALIKNRDWPTDMALNHDHYIHGTPKK